MIMLGLGSNSGDRANYLQRAVTLLKAIVSDMRISRVYESEALLPEDAPLEWNTPFLNMAVSGTTTLAPREVLREIKGIEHTLGRKARGHWGPREIDIDILAYGDTVIDEADLVIPHKELLKRDFALIPMNDIVPHWVYPAAGESLGKTIAELCAALPTSLKTTGVIVS